MAENPWREIFRLALPARHPTGLDEAGLERAVEAAELLRKIAEPLGGASLENGEMPFSNRLPPPADGE